MRTHPEEERLMIFTSGTLEIVLVDLIGVGLPREGGLKSTVILSVQQTLVDVNSKIISGSRGVTVRRKEFAAW